MAEITIKNAPSNLLGLSDLERSCPKLDSLGLSSTDYEVEAWPVLRKLDTLTLTLKEPAATFRKRNFPNLRSISLEGSWVLTPGDHERQDRRNVNAKIGGT